MVTHCRRRTFYRQHRSATGINLKQATSYDWERQHAACAVTRHAVAAGPLHHNWAVPHATRWRKLARNRYRLGLNCMQAPRRHTVRGTACCHRPAFITGTRQDHHAGYHPQATLRLVQRRSAGPAHQPVLASHATILTVLACGYRASYRLHAVTTANYPVKELCIGAIRVPANGQLVLFLADHPPTGGYPVIGAVAHYHLDIAGQLPPNCQIRFRAIHLLLF